MGDWQSTFSQGYSASGYFPCTPDSAAHTKGPWAGFAGPASGVGLNLRLTYWSYYSTPRTIVFDVGIGESGSQIVLIPDMIFSPSHFGSGEYLTRIHSMDINIPIYVPNSKIWTRNQSSLPTHAFQEWIEPTVIKYGGQPCGSVCTAYGISTATSLGTLVTAGNGDNVSGSWTQITGSCERIRAFLVACNSGTTSHTAFPNQWSTFDVAVGPAGQEVIILTPAEGSSSSATTGVPMPPFLGPYVIDIKAGSRISIRLRVQHAGSSQRSRYFTIYGIR